MNDAWRPSASLEALRARAALLARTRAFFAARGVLEVETPQLGRCTVTEPAIESLAVPLPDGARYLQTSPEYAMKRLLAAGSGDIYQVARVFRAGEAGARHNPEFTLLEWYRAGFDLDALVDETLDYVACALELASAPPGEAADAPRRTARRFGWHGLLAQTLGIRWSTAAHDGHAEHDAEQLLDGLRGAGFAAEDLARFDTHGLMDLAYDTALRRLGPGVVVVQDFPPAAAALARLSRDADGRTVARRFEVIVDGVEVANGYHELQDVVEQRRRFAADRMRRAAAGQPQPEIDEALLAALASGMPDCAGVAVGLDRLLMLRLGAAHIAGVLAFDFTRA